MAEQKILFKGDINNRGNVDQTYNVSGKFVTLFKGLNKNVTITNAGVWQQIKLNENLIIVRRETLSPNSKKAVPLPGDAENAIEKAKEATDDKKKKKGRARVPSQVTQAKEVFNDPIADEGEEDVTPETELDDNVN